MAQTRLSHPTHAFKAGGTLSSDSPSYVPRPADSELLVRVQQGEFCYILTPRQMGKSSLMIRIADQLRQQGTAIALIDLSDLGKCIERDQWYLGFIKLVTDRLKLPVQPQQWWNEQGSLSAVQRLTRFVREVLLHTIPGNIVLFIDEIDSTINLDFTDDFFAAIRSCYNQRATNEAYQRITFVLLGVASPTDLMKHPNQTPFNIGHALDLHELTRADADPLQQQLETLFPGNAATLLDRAFFWTNGHPYLTQKLCVAIAESPATEWTDDQIDRLVADLFFSEKRHNEENFKFMNGLIASRSDRRTLLTLYQRIHAGEEIAEDTSSFEQNRLKQVGLIGTHGQTLRVRNEIYKRVFDEHWIHAHMPRDTARTITYIAIGVSVVAVLALVLLVLPWQDARKLAITADDMRKKIADTTIQHADLKLNYFFKLCTIEQEGRTNLFFAYHDQGERASTLFNQLSHDKQCTLFTESHVGASQDKVITVVACLADSPAMRHPAVQKSVCHALCQVDSQESHDLKNKYECSCREDYE